MKRLLLGYACLVLAAVFICTAETAVYYYTKASRGVLLLQHYERRVRKLEARIEKLEGLAEAREERLLEFQAWRVKLTLASRIGWPAADAYLRDFPLEVRFEN